MNTFWNLSTKDLSIDLKPYDPTDKLQLVFETTENQFELIITKEQLETLRTAIKFTEEELEDMNEKRADT